MKKGQLLVVICVLTSSISAMDTSKKYYESEEITEEKNN